MNKIKTAETNKINSKSNNFVGHPLSVYQIWLKQLQKLKKTDVVFTVHHSSFKLQSSQLVFHIFKGYFRYIRHFKIHTSKFILHTL